MFRPRFTPRSIIYLAVVVLVIVAFHVFFTSSDADVEIDGYPDSSFSRQSISRDSANSDAHQPQVAKIITLNDDPLNLNQSAKKQNPDSKCIIPKLDQFNPEVVKSYGKPSPLPCSRYAKNWLLIDENGKLQATEYAKGKYLEGDIICKGMYFDRENDQTLKYKKIMDPIKVGFPVTGGDFLKLKCSAKEDKWNHLFMTVAPKEDVIERAKNAQKPKNWSGLSVYWFSLDSLSQMAYRRSLPKTVEYLEKMGAVVLKGYNIVGDGTPQAFIPILTGKTELELPLTRKRYPNAKFVDVYPFIWNNFSDAGYATMYGEDAAAIGTFTYRLKGFKKQPVDHYTRTFFMLSEKTFPSYKCFGSEPQYKAWLRYITEFYQKYPKEVPKFGMMHHSDLSHDEITQVQVADEDFKEHFEQLFESGALDDAVVFIGADHGHRFAALRETQQGQQEERLPFMAVRLPEKFKQTEPGKKMQANLVANADKLTTPFDIHSTLEDILDLPVDLDADQDYMHSRSLSLFRPISVDRTCAQAGVEPHWCTCLAWQDGDKLVAEKLTAAVVQTINQYTSKERKLCAPLRLHQVVGSKMLVPDEKLLKYGGNSDADGFVAKFTGNATVKDTIYMLTFTTVPGNARYEATVEYNIGRDTVTVDMLSISHVNKYGDAPHCIIDKNYFLATYCVCYDKIEGV